MTQKLEDTLKERGSRYGSFFQNSVVSQALKKIAYESPSWPKMRPPQREAVEMIMGKLGRILNGDPEYADNWHDIGGYAKLSEECIKPPLLGPTPRVRKVFELTPGMMLCRIEMFKKEFNFDSSKPISIWGIPRGGTMVALAVWAELRAEGVNLVADVNDADVIVDDIYDTGQTYEDWKKRFPSKEFWFLVDKRTEPAHIASAWVRFPWEKPEEDGRRGS